MGRDVKVLVVDDESDLCHIVAEQISEISNVSCDCTYSAEEAIELLESRAYDILLSDIKMPGMNGLDLVRTVKSKADTQTLCFIMTGYSSFTKEQVEEAGALSLYHKPGDFPVMIDEIKGWVETIEV